MIDLSTTYLGLKLHSPLVSSASPLTHEFSNVIHLEDAGASAIVFHSVFEESAKSRPALDHYLDLLRRAKESCSVPVIASLGATTLAGWTDYGTQIEQTGVDALELNLYQVPSQADVPGAELEKGYIEVVRSIRSAVKIPIAAKLTPFYTSMPNMARRFVEAGADGLVLFNRFYQPDVNLSAMEIEPVVLLSSAQDLRAPLTWIGILYGRVKASLAGTSGVHSPEDVAKLLLVGADVTMVCSFLLRHGIDRLRDLETGLSHWMEKHRFNSVAEIKGKLSQIHCPDPSVFERSQYINAVKGIEKVVLTSREAWRLLTDE
jgi:dihydroorotate dehydrogenase (fumarate)